MQKEIKHIMHLNQTPQEVWEYLTKPELIEQWLGETDFKPIVGHKFRFISPYGNDSICEVLEVIPFTKLSYSWQKNSAIDNKPFTSKVEWTLIPKENGTELQLVHTGFTTMEDIVAHEAGWKTCLKQLEEQINTNNQNKINIMKNTITQTIRYEHSPEAVWEYLTNAELMAQWLMPNNFEPIKGHDFEFRSKPIPSLNLDGIFRCKVMEIIPFRKLIYSWTGGPETGVKTLDTIVEWTLEAKGNGTELHLVQTGFNEENISIFSAMQGGWAQNLQKVATLLSPKK